MDMDKYGGMISAGEKPLVRPPQLSGKPTNNKAGETERRK
jgi:hypothetical protein